MFMFVIIEKQLAFIFTVLTDKFEKLTSTGSARRHKKNLATLICVILTSAVFNYTFCQCKQINNYLQNSQKNANKQNKQA